jgi:feruloyl esterase
VLIYPGYEPGSEPAWPASFTNPFPIPLSYYRWLVFGDTTWNWRTFDLRRPSDVRAYRASTAKYAPILNATDPDLSAFRRGGGKLIHTHGWVDQLIAPRNSINYYESVIAHLANGRNRGAALADVQSFYRLFMMPGTAHCGGGPGPNTVDLQAALEAWVEQGRAPESITASRLVNGMIERSRPLCPYPKVAVYGGRGSTNDAANFSCREP